MSSTKTMIGGVLVLLALAACGRRPPATVTTDRWTAAPDTVADWSGFASKIHRDGRVFVSGQPDSAALTELGTRGVRCVVSLRTPKEMDDRKRVKFDEAAMLDDLGVEYVHIPLGGRDHPYTPAAVDAFAAALERHDGPVLLHCASGGRAAYVWAAYLVRHAGLPFDQALARGEAVGISRSPLAGLLDEPVTLTVDGD